MTLKHEKSKKVVGAGRLFFEQTDGSGVPIEGGEVYLGDSPGFSLTVENESIEDRSSDGPVAEKDVDVAIFVNRNFSLQTKNINVDNLALFVIGSVGTVTQTATPVVDEAIDGVQPGRYYQLGVSASNPTGVRGVTAVTVTDDTAVTTYVLDTDYELDAASGRIRIIPGGGIAADSDILVDYTPVANSRQQVTTDNLGAKYGRLRYIEDATFGQGHSHDVFAPFVQMKPDGELAMKSRDTVQQMGWTVSVLTPVTGGSALYFDGVPQAT